MAFTLETKNQKTIDNLNKYLSKGPAHQVQKSPTFVNLSHFKRTHYDRSSNWVYKELGWDKTVKQHPEITLNESAFKEDHSLLNSDLFSTNSGNSKQPLGDFYALLDEPLHHFTKFYANPSDYRVERAQNELNRVKTRIAINPGKKEEDDTELQTCVKKLEEEQERFQQRKEKRLQSLSTSPIVTKFLPLIFDTTGLLPEITTSSENDEFTMDIECFESLVPYSDPIREKQVLLNKKLIMLQKYAENMSDESEFNETTRYKYNALCDLSHELRKITLEFFRDYNENNLRGNAKALKERYVQFKVDFQCAINENSDIDLHRGYLRPIIHATLSLAAGFGIVTATIDYGCRALTGSPAFAGATTSRAKVEDIRKSIGGCVEEMMAEPTLTVN